MFIGVLGIIESGFSGTRVLKLSDVVLKTSESSFSESDCGNTVLDRTTTTSLCTGVVPRARLLWSWPTQRYAADHRPQTSGPLCKGLETEPDQPGG